MDAPAQRLAVLEAFVRALAADPARPQALGWTRMGLVEATRRRRRPALAEILSEPRPRRKTALTIALAALAAVERAGATRPLLRVAPAVAAALDGPAAAARRDVEARLHVPLAIETSSSLDPESFELG
jgi:ribonuclease G